MRSKKWHSVSSRSDRWRQARDSDTRDHLHLLLRLLVLLLVVLRGGAREGRASALRAPLRLSRLGRRRPVIKEIGRLQILLNDVIRHFPGLPASPDDFSPPVYSPPRFQVPGSSRPAPMDRQRGRNLSVWHGLEWTTEGGLFLPQIFYLGCRRGCRGCTTRLRLQNLGARF